MNSNTKSNLNLTELNLENGAGFSLFLGSGVVEVEGDEYPVVSWLGTHTNVHLLIANIEALKDNHTPSTKLLTKSSSTSPKSFLEETNTFHNSLPEFENFYFDLEEISSGSTTTYSDISLSDYEAFYFDDDHIIEISSGSTTIHSGISLSEYDSFTFDLSNDQCPPTDRSDFTHEEFVDELAHIISPPEYDCFYFRNLPDPGELMYILNFGICENLSFTTCVNLPIEDDHSPLLAYVVWIFLAYLTLLPKDFILQVLISPASIGNQVKDKQEKDKIGSKPDKNRKQLKKVHQALKDPILIEAMQEELLQFKMQKGHTQEEGIDYKEVFAPVARIEAIRLFLAYASFMGFIIYQMDVKSAFLYRTIEEEVYVCQPPRFEDLDYLDKVYKVVKALYGLHQAPRAWYETLANYLLENGFQRGNIDPTLFIKKQKGDILLVRVYVDDIIFRSTNKELCKAFEKLMKDKKFVLMDGKSASTPIDTKNPLLKDPDDIMFAACTCGILNPFNLVAYSDSDYAGASLDRKSTAGDCVPNEEIFAELARMGYEKPPPKLTFYKAFFSAQWNMVRNVDSPSKFLMYPWFLQVMINSQVDDISSHTTKYTSTTLTQKIFSNMRRIGKGFSGVETPLFDIMLVQPPADAEEKDDDDEVAHLEQDKVAQALEIIKLKQRVKKLEKKRRFKHSGLKRLRKVGKKIVELDAGEDVTLVDMDTIVEMDADIQGRMEEDVIAVKEVNVIEPVVFDNEEENIDWNVIVEQMQEKHLENIKKYTKFKEETNLCNSSQEKHDCIFKEYGWVEDATLQGDEEPIKKRAAKETLLHESFKKLRAEVDVTSSHTTQQDTPTVDLLEISKEDVQNMLQIVLIVEFKVEALQVKEDLDALWRLVKERFSTALPTVDKEKALWAELTRLYEPNADDVFWKLQIYMHYPIMWKLHSNCGVHQVSSPTRRYDIYMLAEKDYPLSNVMTLMLSSRLQVKKDSEMARDLVMKIFLKANQPKRKSLDTSSM
nr:hypothetical protein [Tanacetum cinerariifolium]